MFPLLHENFSLPGKGWGVTPQKTGRNEISTGSKELSGEKKPTAASSEGYRVRSK